MLLELLELASNKTLEHDPKTQARLARLQGKTMALHIKTLRQSLAVTPQAEGLEFSNTIPEQTDVTLKITINAMMKISRDGIEDADLQPGELEMTGDPIVGQRFAQILANLNIDWESLLAERVGDGPASVITAAADQARHFVQESQLHIKTLAANLMKDELDLVAGRQEVDRFLDEVDAIRADTDRLHVRLKRLQSN